MVGLCRARDVVLDDATAAEGIFLDDVHPGLHVIVDAIQDDARDAAAVVLRDKQRVENAFAEDAPSDEIEVALDDLIVSTTTALDRLGIDAPRC